MAVTTVSPRQAFRPYFLLAIDQLPESLLELAKSHLTPLASQAIEGIFVIPPETHKHGSRWSLNPLQAIIFTTQGVLQVISSKGGRPGEGVWVCAGDIFMIKLSMILLRVSIRNGKNYPSICFAALSSRTSMFSWSPLRPRNGFQPCKPFRAEISPA